MTQVRHKTPEVSGRIGDLSRDVGFTCAVLTEVNRHKCNLNLGNTKRKALLES